MSIYEEYQDEEVWELVEQDPRGEQALCEDFEKLAPGNLQKTYSGGLILPRYAYLPVYACLTDIRGFPLVLYGEPIFQGVKKLKGQGQIKP